MLLIQFQLVPNPGVRLGIRFELNCPIMPAFMGICWRAIIMPIRPWPTATDAVCKTKNPANRKIVRFKRDAMPSCSFPICFPKHELGSCADHFAPAPPLNNYRQDAAKIPLWAEGLR